MCPESEKNGCPEEPFGTFAAPDEEARKHAEVCPSCRSALEFVERLREAFAEEAASLHAPQGFAEKVMLSVRENPQTGTRRIAERVERRAAKRRAGLGDVMRRYAAPFAVSAAAAMLFLVGSAFWQFRINRMYRFTYTSAEARYEQRRGASALFVVIDGGRADVRGVIPDGAVYLVGQMDDAVFGETCIFAYGDDQWRRLERKVSAIGDDELTRSWEKMRRNSTIVRVKNGSLPIPEEMWKRYLHGREEIALFAFTDRSEIWDRYTLEEYLRPPVRMDG